MPWDPRLKRRLKLRDLDTFVAVAQWGSMAKAAARLSTSQPAISKAIADMEHTLGVPLLNRTARGVEPNLYGRALLKWSGAMFDDLRQGVNEIAFLADPNVGELRIGATEPMIAGILPAILDRLCRRHPRISFHVMHLVSIADQHQQLRERHVDLLLGRVSNSKGEDDLDTKILFDDPQFVVAGSNNPLSRRRKVSLADLADEPWTLPRVDTLAGALIHDTFRASGLASPNTGVVWSSIQMHTALLATGRYLAIFSASVLKFHVHREAIKVLPIKLPNRPAPVGIMTLKNHTISPIAQLFIDCAREVSKPLSANKNSLIRHASG